MWLKDYISLKMLLNKYVGVKTDINLGWQYHVNDLPIKLNRANAFFLK